MEREVFTECGAWKNFWDLEESLTLDELSELYECAIERQNRFVKIMAAAQGIELDDPDEEKAVRYSSDQPFGGTIDLIGAEQAAALPYGLGYTEVGSA